MVIVICESLFSVLYNFPLIELGRNFDFRGSLRRWVRFGRDPKSFFIYENYHLKSSSFDIRSPMHRSLFIMTNVPLFAGTPFWMLTSLPLFSLNHWARDNHARCAMVNRWLERSPSPDKWTCWFILSSLLVYWIKGKFEWELPSLYENLMDGIMLCEYHNGHFVFERFHVDWSCLIVLC